MKKIIQKSLSLLSACLLALPMSITPTFAAQPDVSDSDNLNINIDCNAIDLSKPFEVSQQFTNDKGETVTIGAVYIPNENPDLTRGSVTDWDKTYDATVGTWTSFYDGGLISEMSYQYDVSRSGSHWKISNARNLIVRMALSEISNKSLTINRAVSTPTFKAEVMGMCTIKLLDTPVGAVVSYDAWIMTTIDDNGTLTVSGN